MSAWLDVINRWLTLERDEEGQGIVEYGLIIVLIAIACFTALMGVGNAIYSDLYGQIVSTLLPAL